MTDTNKERADFEAHYFAENGNRLYCESQWRGWKAHASLAAKAPAAPTGWYALAAGGMATLCVDRDDAEKTAAESEKEWPNCGPFRAVQLYTATRSLPRRQLRNTGCQCPPLPRRSLPRRQLRKQ